MDGKLLLAAIDAIDACIEEAEGHKRDTEAHLRYVEGSVMEMRDRRAELVKLRGKPKIIDYHQETWQFPR